MTPELASDSSGEDSDAYYSQDDTSTETRSEYSLRTPEEFSMPKMDKLNPQADLAPSVYMPPARTSSLIKKQPDRNVNKQRPISSAPPKMLATLTTTSDISYDRFSLIVDPSQIPDYEIEISDESSSDNDDDEDLTNSPIETAKPITYSAPKARPAMIFISNFQGMKTLDMKQRRLSQNLSLHRRSSTRSTISEGREGFLAAEASPVETNLQTRSTSPTFSYRPDTHDTLGHVPKRKSSMPLLFSSAKTGHSRMSSLRNLIRSSTASTISSTSQLDNIQEERSRRESAEERRDTVRRSMTDPTAIQRQLELRRPQTARPSSKEFGAEDAMSMLSSPLPSPSLAESDTSQSTSDQSLAARRKSFSKLRSRSGSIGQALRFGKAPDTVNLPPLPSIRIPSSASTNDLGRYPSPPPLSPRDPRRSVTGHSATLASEHRSSGLGFGRRKALGV